MSKEILELSKALSNDIKSGNSFQVRERKCVSKSYVLFKRIIDIVLSILGLIIASPVFLLITIFYLFGESKGPLVFKQQRYGEKGNKFDIYKIRSMVVNADERLKANKQLYKKYLQNNYKLEQWEDPRITKIGRFLRKTSLDELPQLINVLKGDMSIVGPRPVVEEEIKEYRHFKDDFLSVKPGITGFWQISGRSNVGYPERVELELYYVYHQSLLLDIKIILKTIIVVIFKKGAY
ncbi:MAG: sugar transferase [Bacilli bacterium]